MTTKLFGPRVKTEAEIAADAAQKALVQRESDLKNPATGHGISVKEAAYRLGVSLSTVYRWIAKGKFASSRKDHSRAGGRMQLWVSGVEVFQMKGSVVRFSDADLH